VPARHALKKDPVIAGAHVVLMTAEPAHGLAQTHDRRSQCRVGIELSPAKEKPGMAVRPQRESSI
jgi:hypothetical protein